MRRLWLRWALLIVFVAILGAVFVNLGSWQLDRLAQRKARNSTTLTNESRPVRPFTDIFTGEIRDADQWQRVEARGTFDAEHQFVLRYRRNGDAEGYEVVTPLRTAAGVVLVDRGFVALGARQPDPRRRAGPARRRGHRRRTRAAQRAGPAGRRHPGRRPDAVDQLRRHRPHPGLSDHERLHRPDHQHPRVRPAVSKPVRLPEISDGPHFWYAVQWFLFTGIAVAGIVVFIRGDLKDRRKAGV